MLEAHKDKHFVAPGIAWLINTSYYAAEWGITPDKPGRWAITASSKLPSTRFKKMHTARHPRADRRRLRICVDQARHQREGPGVFRQYLGFTPMEALTAATRYGAEVMMKGSELGQVKDGYLADLLLIDGDPLANIAILQDPARLLAVMKDGRFHKEPDIQSARSVRPAVA